MTAPSEGTGEARRPRGLDDADPVPTVDDLRRQQRREAEHIGLGTEGQTKGAALGWLFGATVGGLLFLAIGAVASDAPVVTIVMAVMGAAFGGVAGGVYGGSRRPELTNETLDLSGRPETQPADDLDP